MSSRVIVALDFPDARAARAFVEPLTPSQCRLKVGFELFVSEGPALVAHLVERGFDVFLDLKFHDIPNTVAAACRAAAGLGVWMVNVHASGGRVMMSRAREAVDASAHRPKIIAVTVLTSMDDTDLAGIGVTRPAAAQAVELARLTHDCGLDGVVCSAAEAGQMRSACGEDFLLVTPGIRPGGSEQGDQKRIMTPSSAVEAGADYLVIGRPITQATDPVAMLESINAELAALTG